MRFREFAFYDRILIFFAGSVVLFSFIANLLRFSQVPFFYKGEYSILVLISFFTIALMRAPLLRIPFAGKSFLVLFFSFLVFIFLVGVVRETEDPISGLKYYILPFAAFILLAGSKFMLFFYTSAFFWIATIVGHLVGLLYYYGFLVGSVYPGIGVQSAAYAALFFFIRGQYFLFLLSSVVVFLEGKRSILLSLIMCLALMPILRLKHMGRILYIPAGIITLVVILAILFSFIADIQGSAMIDRLNYLNPYSHTFNIFLGSSGRMGEIISYWFDKTLGDILIGSGSGFQYVWDLGYASQQAGEVKGYFHFSFANYIAAGGILGMILSVYIVTLPFKSLELTKKYNLRSITFMFALFSLVQSFFGFNLSVDPFSWFTILGPMMLLGVFGRTCLIRQYRSGKSCAAS